MQVNSSVSNAYANQLAQSERSQQAQQSRQLQQEELQAPEQQERVEKKEEAPKPVANAQGQTTGQVINVTA